MRHLLVSVLNTGCTVQVRRKPGERTNFIVTGEFRGRRVVAEHRRSAEAIRQWREAAEGRGDRSGSRGPSRIPERPAD